MEDECPDGVASSSVNDEGVLEVVCAGSGRGIGDGLSIPPEFLVFMALFALVVLAIIIAAVKTQSKRKQALQQAGLNPYLTGDEQIAAAHRARSASAPVPAAPARSVEERLAELDDLLGREKITADEHARARLHVLTDQ